MWDSANGVVSSSCIHSPAGPLIRCQTLTAGQVGQALAGVEWVRTALTERA